jgi:thioredoxin reductase (NADPH)
MRTLEIIHAEWLVHCAEWNRVPMSEPDLRSIAFPKLTESQIQELGRCSHADLERCPAGTVLFRVGDRGFKFFVIQSGEIEILDESLETPRTVTVHHAGEFTGDVAHLTGRPSVVTAIARTDCELYEMSGEAVRQVINQCPDLGDVILQAFIARRQLLRESGGFAGLRVIGSRYSRDTFRVRDFLAKNRVLFKWLDLESDPDVDHLLRRFGVGPEETPVVVWGNQSLRNPSNLELAEALGIRRPLEHKVYDLAVVGSGPAGLAAAVYGASEGLDTVVLEREAPGGQAGTSMRIENYLGFPTGITGGELADRAVLQADKFGALVSVPTPVSRLTFENGYPVLTLEGGETILARCILISTGAQYQRLPVEGCERFEGSGVYYAATFNEAQLCRAQDVVIVGGGNSAGQAAVFLSGTARRVLLVVRGGDLGKSMSSYLVRRIEQIPNIEVLLNSEVKKMSGTSHLNAVQIVNNVTGEVRRVDTPALFSFIGATPRTDWLPPEIEKDGKDFVRTGSALTGSRDRTARRQPFLLETSRPGVFAAGDVRSGSVKRVASAVGEGAMAVQFVHEYLKEM